MINIDSTPEHQTRVLVADDDWDTRAILSDALAYRGYETIVASDGEQALALAATHPLEIALVDVVMPGPAGLELAARLKELQPQIEVILITAFGSTELAVEAMYQGVFYYLSKPLSTARLLEVVGEARARQRMQGQALTGKAPGMPWALKELTRREQEVLAWLAKGKTDSEVAWALSISKRTVNAHVSNLRHKLGARNRVQAAVLWERYERGS